MNDLSELTAKMAGHRAANDWLEWTAAKAIANPGGNDGTVADILTRRGVSRDRVLQFEKAAIGAHSGSANPELVEARLGQPFLDALRAVRLLPRIPGTSQVPVNTRVPLETSDVIAAFITEGVPIPAAALAFSDATITYGKLAFIAPISNELARLGATPLLTRLLRRPLVRGENTAFLGTQAATDFGTPEGLLHNITATGGGSPLTLHPDLTMVWRSVRGGDPLNPAWITSPRGAAWLAGLREDGTPEFPDISPATGGAIWGVPVLLAPEAGNRLILADGAEIVWNEAGLLVERAGATSLQMADNPTNGAANMVSMFQANSTAMRAIQYVTWAFGADDRAAFIELPIDSSPS